MRQGLSLHSDCDFSLQAQLATQNIVVSCVLSKTGKTNKKTDKTKKLSCTVLRLISQLVFSKYSTFVFQV